MGVCDSHRLGYSPGVVHASLILEANKEPISANRLLLVLFGFGLQSKYKILLIINVNKTEYSDGIFNEYKAHYGGRKPFKKIVQAKIFFLLMVYLSDAHDMHESNRPIVTLHYTLTHEPTHAQSVIPMFKDH